MRNNKTKTPTNEQGQAHGKWVTSYMGVNGCVYLEVSYVNGEPTGFWREKARWANNGEEKGYYAR